jgi:hypothetical protein
MTLIGHGGPNRRNIISAIQPAHQSLPGRHPQVNHLLPGAAKADRQLVVGQRQVVPQTGQHLDFGVERRRQVAIRPWR